MKIHQMPERTVEEIRAKLLCYGGEIAVCRNIRRDLERKHMHNEHDIREIMALTDQLMIKVSALLCPAEGEEKK